MFTVRNLIILTLLALVPPLVSFTSHVEKRKIGRSVELDMNKMVDESYMMAVINLKRIAEDSSIKELNIDINSPGGYIDVGVEVLEAMDEVKNAGITVNCYVGKMAASMAFVFVANCDNRFSLKSSKLLTHYGAVGCYSCRIDTPTAIALAADLVAAGKELEKYIRASFKVSDETWVHLNTTEAWMSPRETNSHSPNWIQCVDRSRRVISCGRG